MAQSGQPRYVPRWSLAARLTHWGFAIAFLALLASGLALGDPDLRGIPFMGSKLVREIHLTWALLLLVLPALAASWDGFQDLRGVWREARQWDAADRRWLARVAGRLVGRAQPLPPQGRLNGGQKLNVLLVVGWTVLLGLTGLLIAPEAGRPVPREVREAVYDLHVWLAYGSVPLVAGHILLATVWPPTRAALRGMLLGSVRADWAAEHHARWLSEGRRP